MGDRSAEVQKGRRIELRHRLSKLGYGHRWLGPWSNSEVEWLIDQVEQLRKGIR